MNYGVSGGVVVHRNGVTLSQPLGDTNILVKAPGAAGVELENATGVKTDWRGYAVIPYATTYRQNRVALNTNPWGRTSILKTRSPTWCRPVGAGARRI